MWCGAEPTRFILAGTVNPCIFNTFAALLLAIWGSISLIKEYRKLIRLTALPSRIELFWSLPKVGPLHAAQLAVASSLALFHTVALFYFLDHVKWTPYAIFSEALLALTWTGVLVLLIWVTRKHVCTSLRSLALLVAGLYAFGLYSEVQIYVHGIGISPFQRKFRLISSIVASIFALAFAIVESYKPDTAEAEEDALHEALLSNDHNNQNGNTTSDIEGASKPQRHHSWVSLVGIAANYMWPTGLALQIRAGICVILIVVLRLLNLAVPLFYKRVVDQFASISEATHTPPSPDQPEPPHFTFHGVFFPYVFIYLALFFLQGGTGGGVMGIIGNIRSFLWIPIGQNTFRRASLDVFNHAMNMDLDFHLHRKTGELLRIMDRGTSSIQTLLSTVAFQIGPAVFDIAVASAYMAVRLQAWIAVIVFITLGTYIPMTVYITEWRGQYRRELNRLDNARSARATDALLNYETVKYFANEDLESDNYAKAIDAYQKIDFRLSSSMNMLNIAQSIVIVGGIASGLAVCTNGIANGSLTVGDAVLFVTLMQQLYAPLNFFGTYYRMIQQSMIDMESMFDLLKKLPGVGDHPNAKDIDPRQPHDVSFEEVWFQYRDNAPVLKGISFRAVKGSTVAFVGATGSGKSTVLRLLLRFYDPLRGMVKIDGMDVSKVTLRSLRKTIGVVPQDTVLFNDTIKYNIRYGRPTATDDDVEEAADAACIAETIRTRFPLGYDTLVGERGLRLSGGEKQRVAFARALLKDPPILVLDEATSALDSLTERKIQATLGEKRHDRTVIVVAHRLSTIMDADTIIVMKHGEIAESGSHDELLSIHGGLYAEMWKRQLEAGEGASSSSANQSRVASYAALPPVGGGNDESVNTTTKEQ